MKIDRSEIRQTELIENLMALHKMLCIQGKSTEAIELTRFLRKQLKKRGKEIVDIVPEHDGNGR